MINKIKDYVFKNGIIEVISDFFVYTIPAKYDDIYYAIKYAYQRVVRGYDNRMLWNYDYYNAKMTIEVLTHLRHKRMGSPSLLETKKGVKDIHAEWDKKLDLMIAAFEAVLKIDDVFVVDKKGNYDAEKTKKEIAKLDKIWNKGIAEYTKYYRSLWD